MDILFITPDEQLKLNSITNGSMLLGTILLQAGFDVGILRYCQINSYKKDYNVFIEEITDRIIQMNPKCVSFYTLWPYYHIVLRIAKELKDKKNNSIIVLGGPHASATASETMEHFDYIDYICTGEGEKTVVPFFTAILRNNGLGIGSLPGLYYRQKESVLSNTTEIPLCDLNTLPYWDKRLFSAWNPTEEPDIQAANYYMPIDAGRGCPFGCTFCSTSQFWRRTYRLKSADRLIEEIEYYNKTYGIKSFYLSHDAFTVNKNLVSEFCDKLIKSELNITWRCSTRIDCLSEELLSKMVQAGLRQIEVGIETGSARMQKIVNKRLNLEYAKHMISKIIEKKLYIQVYFMYGFPEETEDDLNQTLEFLFTLLDEGVNQTSLTLCKFSPATKLTNYYFNQLTLDTDYKILSRGVFGYKEEIDIIKNHKAEFSSMYNLNTPLRQKYEFLIYFRRLYEKYKLSMRFLRQLYHGDNLAFYLDFYNSNIKYFTDTITLGNALKNHGVELLNNAIQNSPFRRQLSGLFLFNHDYLLAKSSKEDVCITKSYDFNYMDYLDNLQIEQYSDYKSEIIIQKQNTTLTVQVVNIVPFES